MKSEEKMPKYKQIMDDILAQINSNNYSYDTPICTEQSIIDSYHVSRITAVRAITELERMNIIYRRRGMGSFVSRNITPIETQISTTSNISSHKTKTVSFLIPFDISIPWINLVAAKINTALNEQGYFMNIYICNASIAKERETIKILLYQNPSAIVYFPLRDKIHLDLLNKFITQNKPIVIWDKSTDCPYLHNVICDNFYGEKLLTEHLLSLGHRNISYFTTSPIDNTSSVRNRFAGFLQCMQEANIPLTNNSLQYVSCDLGNESPNQFPNKSVVEYVKKMHRYGFTAILAENDIVAEYLCRVCKYLNLKIPNDISICGFDNTEFSKHSEMGITTVQQNYDKTAEEIVSILMKSLSHPTSIQKITVPVELVVRDSTGPVQS